MYSDKTNVNILTALLVKHGIKDAVVCPGSRNAPIVHNLNECPDIRCYPVTDERSAGFFALGLRQATGRPVVVCVTSGTALLNLSPSVAESTYQRQGIIVISADRPAAWIGQQDGQTLPQSGMFGALVARCVSLPEPYDDESRWLCNRLVNEAIATTFCHESASVHINVPISEPLFNFTVGELPDERMFTIARPLISQTTVKMVTEALFSAQKPMVVIGQMADSDLADAALNVLRKNAVVLCEPLSADYAEPFEREGLVVNSEEFNGGIKHEDSSFSTLRSSLKDLLPDFILYVGGTLVSKRLRRFLRHAKPKDCFVVSGSRQMSDTFMSMTCFVDGSAEEFLAMLTAYCHSSCHEPDDSQTSYINLWKEVCSKESERLASLQLSYSPELVVRYFEEQLEDMEYDYQVHYANSTAVRLACRYSQHHVWCNRGVNGIEGSVSTAVGFAAGTSAKVFLVTGDLSFFYDQNALWNQNLSGNLRIIILNDHHGAIFDHLKGLAASPVAATYVCGTHSANAKGICEQNDIGYISARNEDEMHTGIVTLLTEETHRPMALEVFF